MSKLSSKLIPPHLKPILKYMFWGFSLTMLGQLYQYNKFSFDYQSKFYSILEDLRASLYKVQETPLEGADSVFHTGKILFDNKEYQQCIAHFKKAIEILEEESNKSVTFIQSHIYIARAYQELDKHMDAMARLEEVLDFLVKNKNEFFMNKNKRNKYKILLADIFHYMGVSLRTLKRYQDASFFLNRALKLKIEGLGKEDISVAMTYRELGLIDYETQSYSRAYRHLEMVKIILSQIQNTEESEEFRDLWIIDYLELFIRNRLHTLKVEKISQSLKEISKESLSPQVQAALGKLYIYYRKYDIGFEYLNSSLESMASLYGKTHPKTQNLYKEIYQIYAINFRSPREILEFMET